MLENGKWAPTFPRRATSSVGESDFWSAHDDEEQQAMLGDSVKAIFDAGLVELVELDHVVSPEIALTPSTHAARATSMMITSEGERAVTGADPPPCRLALTGRLGDTDAKAAALTRSPCSPVGPDQPIHIGTHFAPRRPRRRDGAAFQVRSVRGGSGWEARALTVPDPRQHGLRLLAKDRFLHLAAGGHGKD